MITRTFAGRKPFRVRRPHATFLQSPPIAPPTEVRADFPAEAASAGSARRFVGDTLRSWSFDGLSDVATLLVSELVANAVLHAGTTIAVVIKRNESRLRIEVHDGNTRTPLRKHYSSLATTGRGLLLVDRMAADWGVTPDRQGKSVWFELDESAPAKDIGLGMLEFDLDELGDAALPGGGADAGRGMQAADGGADDNGRPSSRALVLVMP